MERKKKRKFLGMGSVEKAGVEFEEYGWAFSEADFRRLIWRRLKKRYPRLRVFLVFKSVHDITDLTDEQIKALTRQPT